ncbi:hypothetical protein ZWY2020_053079 [Hordeum vulgare]|nr:hypothetical protein ZWY2020_053079 [Hordeum vulgare]
MDSVKNYTWYYEKFRVHQLDSSISYESRLRSLIQNWSEEKAKKVDNIIQNNYLEVEEYVEDPTRPFIRAQDGTLAKLKTDAQAQIKVLVRRVLTDLQEVASLVREAGAEQVDRMYILEKKMDECLRCTCTNGKLTEDLVKELNVVDAAIELMRHDEPTDTRDGQLVYIERLAGVVKLERDGRIGKLHGDALTGIPGTTQGTSYLKHDMVFLPTRSLNVHWFLVVVNPRRKEIQANIDEFRREIPVVLVDSPYNKMKYKKRFKPYHARLSDAAAVEDYEDASS